MFLVLVCSPPKSDVSTDLPPIHQNCDLNYDVGEIHNRFLSEDWGDFSTWEKQGNDSRYIYLNMSEFWPHSIIRKSTEKELNFAPRKDVASFNTLTRSGKMTLDEYVQKADVNGLVIIHKGEIVYESYPRMCQDDRHTWKSVSKTLVSTSIAILEDRGLLNNQDFIHQYFPQLESSGWANVKIVDILSMSSGIDCITDFSDPESCWQQLFLEYGWPNQGKVTEDIISVFAQMKSKRPSGKVFAYTDTNTLLLTLLVEKVYGKRFVEFLETEIWTKIGATSDATMLLGGYGRAATPLGMSSTLRDLARFGLAFTPSGRMGKNQLISQRYLDNIQKNCSTELDKLDNFNWINDDSWMCNAYQWDIITTDGDFFKSGADGQGLYISPLKDVVIAFFGTTPKEYDWPWHELPAIARQMTKSDLFTK